MSIIFTSHYFVVRQIYETSILGWTNVASYVFMVTFSANAPKHYIYLRWMFELFWFLNKLVIINLPRTVFFFTNLFSYVIYVTVQTSFLYCPWFIGSLYCVFHLVPHEFHTVIHSVYQYYHYILFSRAILLAEADASTLMVETILPPICRWTRLHSIIFQIVIFFYADPYKLFSPLWQMPMFSLICIFPSISSLSALVIIQIWTFSLFFCITKCLQLPSFEPI